MSSRSLSDLIADALRAALGRRHARRLPVFLPTDGRGGLQPGVDLDDSAALLDLMEDRTPDD